MKLGAVTKIDKGNTVTSKKLDNDVMAASCDVSVFFPIYGQFAAIQEPNSGRMVYIKLKFSKIVTFYLTKLENRANNSLMQPSYYICVCIYVPNFKFLA